MLGKLLKYEIKSSARNFILLYIGLIAVTIMQVYLNKYNYFDIELLEFIVAFSLGGLSIFIFISTLVCIHNRFKKNLFTDEGYLMFTLPVKTSQLINSKLITALIWNACSWIVSIISSYILLCSENDVSIIEGIGKLPEIISEIWMELGENIEIPTSIYVVIIIMMITVLCAGFILFIYLCVISNYESKLTNNKAKQYIQGIAAFIVCLIILNKVVPAITIMILDLNVLAEFKLLISAGVIALVDALMYMYIHYKLSNKLNLQ